MQPKEMLDKILAIIDTHKAEETVAFDVRNLVTYADYVVICSGQNSRQVEALASHLSTDLKKSGIFPLGVEGKQSGEWVLLDFGDVVVHVFDEPVRAFYDLDGLWVDAPKVFQQPESQTVSFARR